MFGLRFTHGILATLVRVRRWLISLSPNFASYGCRGLEERRKQLVRGTWARSACIESEDSVVSIAYTYTLEVAEAPFSVRMYSLLAAGEDDDAVVCRR